MLATGEDPFFDVLGKAVAEDSRSMVLVAMLTTMTQKATAVLTVKTLQIVIPLSIPMYKSNIKRVN
jgi:hypothetical protein